MWYHSHLDEDINYSYFGHLFFWNSEALDFIQHFSMLWENFYYEEIIFEKIVLFHGSDIFKALFGV